MDAVCQQGLTQGLEAAWPPAGEPGNVRETHPRHPDGHAVRVSRVRP